MEQKTKLIQIAKVFSRLEVLKSKQDLIFLAMDEEQKKEFKTLLDDYQEVLKNLNGKKQGEDFIDDLLQINLESFVDRTIKLLDQLRDSAKEEIAKKAQEEEELNLKDLAKEVKEQGTKYSDSKSSKGLDPTEEAKKESPIAFILMEIMQELGQHFIKILRDKGVKVNVPITEFGKILKGITIEYGEEGINEVPIEEALKAVKKFLPLVIMEELKRDIEKETARKIKELMKAKEKNSESFKEANSKIYN